MGLGDMIQKLTGYPDASPLAKAIGRTVESVKPGTPMVLTFTDKSVLTIDLEGDCCSSSYFTEDASKDVMDLVGAKIINGELESSDGKHGPYATTEDFGEVSWHFLKFNTDKGDVTLDWRNDSNGYYDGWIVASFKEVQ